MTVTGDHRAKSVGPGLDQPHAKLIEAAMAPPHAKHAHPQLADEMG